MAFVKKTWKDRIAEFPTRRRLTKSNGDSELVTVAREEGTLSQEGDAFSAENMNDLESRVDNAISEINSNLGRITNLQPNTEIKVGTFGGKELYRKIIIKDFNTSGLSGTRHIFDETILSENILSINAIVNIVEDGSSYVISNYEMSLNVDASGKIYSSFVQEWTTATYTWRYKLDVLYTK